MNDEWAYELEDSRCDFCLCWLTFLDELCPECGYDFDD